MKGDAVIKGVVPKRGMYLVHREHVKTMGRVVRVYQAVMEYPKDMEPRMLESTKVVWWSNFRGHDVPSNPDPVREEGYEWSDAPLADYVVKHPFPYLEQHPEIEPEDIDEEAGEAAALAHAEKGDTARAAAIFVALGNEEAADLCRRTPPRWL